MPRTFFCPSCDFAGPRRRDVSRHLDFGRCPAARRAATPSPPLQWEDKPLCSILLPEELTSTIAIADSPTSASVKTDSPATAAEETAPHVALTTSEPATIESINPVESVDTEATAVAIAESEAEESESADSPAKHSASHVSTESGQTFARIGGYTYIFPKDARGRTSLQPGVDSPPRICDCRVCVQHAVDCTHRHWTITAPRAPDHVRRSQC